MSKRYWLYLGIATEVCHVIFLVAVLLTGRLWLPGYVVDVMVILTVAGQMIFLWCPFSVFSNYCFRKHDSELKFKPSLTLRLYSRYGRVVAIPILIVLMVASMAIIKILF